MSVANCLTYYARPTYLLCAPYSLCAQVIALLDEYHLSKDDFDAIMELELLTGAGTEVPYYLVSSKLVAVSE